VYEEEVGMKCDPYSPSDFLPLLSSSAVPARPGSNEIIHCTNYVLDYTKVRYVYLALTFLASACGCLRHGWYTSPSQPSRPSIPSLSCICHTFVLLSLTFLFSVLQGLFAGKLFSLAVW